jgi:hypothetical protein
VSDGALPGPEQDHTLSALPPAHGGLNRCPNCDTPITGKYCSTCGQRQVDVRKPVRGMVRELLEDQLSVDAALPRTLKLLFLRPGQLTREYVQLHIARFVHPLRLYLLASLLFFLTLSVLSRFATAEMPTGAAADSIRAAIDSVRAESAANGDSTGAIPGRVGVSIDPTNESWAESAQVHTGSARLDEAIKNKLRRLEAMPPGEAMRSFIAEFLRQAPTVMFLILPIYALLLKILYVRRDYFYAEHFAFALHIHAFTYLLLFLWLLLRSLPLVTAAVMIWLPVYAWLAMKRFYGQGWIKTTLKWSALAWSYLFVVSMGMIAGFVLVILSV